MPPEGNFFFRNDKFCKGMYIEWKGLITRNVHVEYEICISISSSYELLVFYVKCNDISVMNVTAQISKEIAKIKVFRCVSQKSLVQTFQYK